MKRVLLTQSCQERQELRSLPNLNPAGTSAVKIPVWKSPTRRALSRVRGAEPEEVGRRISGSGYEYTTAAGLRRLFGGFRDDAMRDQVFFSLEEIQRTPVHFHA